MSDPYPTGAEAVRLGLVRCLKCGFEATDEATTNATPCPRCGAGGSGWGCWQIIAIARESYHLRGKRPAEND